MSLLSIEKYRLPVMDAIETSSEVSQRDISKRTEISLGVVNAVLKDLIHRGWIRAHQVPRKRYAYYLTPQGIAEKAQIAIGVFENSIHAYTQARGLADTHAQNFLREGNTEVALVGNGPKLELAYLACLQVGLKVAGIFDDKTQGKITLGFEVKAQSSISEGLAFWKT